MEITTEDCKDLLGRDASLQAQGASNGKGWKRLSKRGGAQGVERVFLYATAGLFAKVVESNGALWVQAVGGSAAALDTPGAQRVGVAPEAPMVSAVSEHPAGENWPAMCASAKDAAKAKEVVELFLRGEGEDEDHHEKVDRLFSKASPIGLANQFTFCFGGGAGWGSALVAIITPTKIWEDEGACYDQESPIAHLLPRGSDDENGCGTWAIPGFAEPMALVKELLSRGFVWEEKFQRFIDSCSDEDGMSALQPLVEARLLEATLAKPSTSAPAPARPRI